MPCSEIEVLQCLFLLDLNPDSESPKGLKSDSGSGFKDRITLPLICVSISLFTASKSVSGITKKLKIQLQFRIQGQNHNTSTMYPAEEVVSPEYLPQHRPHDGPLAVSVHPEERLLLPLRLSQLVLLPTRVLLTVHVDVVAVTVLKNDDWPFRNSTGCQPALGWLDYDVNFPSYCPAAQPLLPNSHQSRHNRAGSETLKVQVNPTKVHEQMGHPVPCRTKNCVEGWYSAAGAISTSLTFLLDNRVLHTYRGDPSGQQLYFVDFDLGVPPCCLQVMPIMPDLQLCKQN